MADSDENLAPATDDGVADALSYALRFNGRRKRFHSGDEFMADLTAKHLVEHLRMSGFVIMKRPPSQGPGTMSHGYVKRDKQ
jgi:hypothetical protein